MLINTYIERFKFLGIALIFLLSAILIETSYFEQQFDINKAQRFQNVLIRKEHSMESLLNEISLLCLNKKPISSLETYLNKKKSYLDRRGFAFLVYKSNQLFYWSNNSFYFPNWFDTVYFSKPVMFVDHSWFYVKKLKKAEFDIIVLTTLKNEYPYENKLLINEFHDDFTVPASIKISSKPIKGYYHIKNAQGQYILSLTNIHTHQKNIFLRNLSISLYFMSFFMILFFMGNYLSKFRKFWIADLINIGFLVFYILARIIMIHMRAPYIFHASPIFDSSFYAFSDRFPSLGELLIDVIFLWYFVNQLHKWLKKSILFKYNKKLGNILIYIFPLITTCFGLFVDFCIQSLVNDSNINFEADKILDITYLSVIGFLIIAVLIFAFVLLAHGTIFLLSKKYGLKRAIFKFLPGFILGILLFWGQPFSFYIRNSAFLISVFILLFFVNFKYKNDFSFSIKVLIIFVTSIFISIALSSYIHSKKIAIKKIYAENLSNERETFTEQMLIDAGKKMRNDSTLASMMNNPLGNEDNINRYIRNKYFGGFLNKYRLETTICGTTDEYNQANQLPNCESYFVNTLFKPSERLEKSGFHFYSKNDGTVSYLDSLTFTFQKKINKLYIELKSRLMTEELGYPELLLNEKNIPKNLYKEYSFAKYTNGKLVHQNGTFSYSLTSDIAKHQKEEYRIETFDGFEHVFYKASDTSVIVVSNQEETYIQILISTSYIFLFFFLLIMLLDLIVAFMNQSLSLRLNFKGKIQALFIGVLVLSLLLIGISMIYLNLHQYKVTQYEQVNDKLQSIAVELEQYAERKDLYDPEMLESFTFKLSRLSNIYFTDINLFDLNGNLITSSRKEIFDWGLSGNKMDINALQSLSYHKRTRFEHIEKIGDLEYLSAYTVLKNSKNEAIAYINVPYFTKQTAITQRLSSLIVAFINIYVLLIVIATLVAVFISNRVTKPLYILKEKIRHIKLRGKNENIEWSSNDEIGSLINDYNRMVRELSESADKLAESEREMAWREMAKQIAHEIKNPLTPMKLNIQLLNRAWETHNNDFEERLKKVSSILIEQIDNLASTANEFSNFALINQAHFETVDLKERIEHCIALFSEELETQFETQFEIQTDATIKADKDKINRVFINLIKNAIQAIPEDRTPKISIHLQEINNSLRISISDNGLGIKPEIRQRLFEPYFTTKSSGSGLGLAIVRNIIQSFKGKIWFETQTNIGTTFFIEFERSIQA